ncbi:site-specific integrase [Haladaptatus sp. YSMS36]|uniref:site-specific integrase n=1 Tax=Haladaptatus sp. YSMS36 TaxID=3033384 RepID=UPI0023E8DB99|nr:site-specific integrase [Haladaptatus sp. YSMS36]
MAEFHTQIKSGLTASLAGTEADCGDFNFAPYLAAWLADHPRSDNPEAYVFVGDPDHFQTNLDEPLCQGTIRRMLQTTAEHADVEKPVNPHNFRHYWTTIMKQEYGLNDEELKFLLGHQRSGNGMNEVYNHSVDSKLRRNIAEKRDGTISSQPKPLTPAHCAECNEQLADHWVFCPYCGTAYGP